MKKVIAQKEFINPDNIKKFRHGDYNNAFLTFLSEFDPSMRDTLSYRYDELSGIIVPKVLEFTYKNYCGVFVNAVILNGSAAFFKRYNDIDVTVLCQGDNDKLTPNKRVLFQIPVNGEHKMVEVFYLNVFDLPDFWRSKDTLFSVNGIYNKFINQSPVLYGSIPYVKDDLGQINAATFMMRLVDKWMHDIENHNDINLVDPLLWDNTNRKVAHRLMYAAICLLPLHDNHSSVDEFITLAREIYAVARDIESPDSDVLLNFYYRLWSIIKNILAQGTDGLDPEQRHKMAVSMFFKPHLDALNINDKRLVRDVINNSEIVSFKRGQRLVNEGDMADSIFFLLSGKVMATTGGHVMLRKVPGTVLGESSVKSDRAKRYRTATVLAGNTVHLLKVDAGVLRSSFYSDTFSDGYSMILNKKFDGSYEFYKPGIDNDYVPLHDLTILKNMTN